MIYIINKYLILIRIKSEWQYNFIYSKKIVYEQRKVLSKNLSW